MTNRTSKLRSSSVRDHWTYFKSGSINYPINKSKKSKSISIFLNGSTDCQKAKFVVSYFCKNI